MPRPGAAELILIRHAPAAHGGRLCGRTDVPAEIPEDLAPWRVTLPDGPVISSPAQRCISTARALFPERSLTEEARFWEQDFGREEGMVFADLPDLGPLPRPALAARRPADGESFLDMATRIAPALDTAARHAREAGPIILVAHAGTVRAALGRALDDPSAGLAFDVAPLSVTRLQCFDGGMSILCTNWLPV